MRFKLKVLEQIQPNVLFLGKITAKQGSDQTKMRKISVFSGLRPDLLIEKQEINLLAFAVVPTIVQRPWSRFRFAFLQDIAFVLDSHHLQFILQEKASPHRHHAVANRTKNINLLVLQYNNRFFSKRKLNIYKGTSGLRARNARQTTYLHFCFKARFYVFQTLVKLDLNELH